MSYRIPYMNYILTESEIIIKLITLLLFTPLSSSGFFSKYIKTTGLGIHFFIIYGNKEIILFGSN